MYFPTTVFKAVVVLKLASYVRPKGYRGFVSRKCSENKEPHGEFMYALFAPFTWLHNKLILYYFCRNKSLIVCLLIVYNVYIIISVLIS